MADIQIFIRPRVFTIHPSFELMVQVPNVVRNIRIRVSNRLNIPTEHLRLERGGVPLHDNDRLTSANDQDTIEVMVRAGGGPPMCSSREPPRALGGLIKAVEVA